MIKKIVQIYFKKKEIFKIFGREYPTPDGTAIRDYIYIKDLSSIHIHCLDYLRKMKNYEKITLNCGYGKGYSVLDVVKSALKLFKFKFKFTKKRKGDSSMLVADNNKMKKILRIKLKRKSLKKIIQSAIKWEKFYKKNLFKSK